MRYTLNQSTNGLEVTFPPPRSARSFAVASLMLLFGISVANWVFYGHGDFKVDERVVKTLVLLLFVGIPLLSLLWQAFGSEHLRVSDGVLVLSWRALGLRYSRRYQLQRIRWLGVKPAFVHRAIGGRTFDMARGSRFGFEYDGSDVMVGQGLTIDEADQLSAEIGRFYPALVVGTAR